MTRIRVYGSCVEVLGDNHTSVLVGKFGVAPSSRCPSELIQFARKIYADFDKYHAYYKAEQDRAHHAEILSVVYGMG